MSHLQSPISKKSSRNKFIFFQKNKNFLNILTTLSKGKTEPTNSGNLIGLKKGKVVLENK